MCTAPVLRRHERGAILVQTAVSILMLMGFAAFVCDYGVVLVSRGQAQNAADAGALAGALALQLDVSDPMDAGQRTATATPIATAAATENRIWNLPGTVSVQYPECGGVPGIATEFCIHVTVYRNGTNGSVALPVFFGPVLGIDWQGVGASAWGRVGAGNATTCVRPFALSDRFIGDADGTFDPGDQYAPPTGLGVGTGGYIVPDYRGTEAIIRKVPDDGNQVGNGWFRTLDLAPAAPGNPERIRACGNQVYGVGDTLTAQLYSGVTSADVITAMNAIIALDPGATWNSATQRVQDSCLATRSCTQYDANGAAVVADPGAITSPRVIALPVIDPVRLAQTGAVEVVNFIGFFVIEAVDGPSGPEIRGVILTKPGLLHSDKNAIYNQAAFLKTAQLVR